MSQAQRVKALRSIIELDDQFNESITLLTKLNFDSQELTECTIDDVRKIMMRFDDAEIAMEKVEKWANTLECRDDIKMSGTVVEILSLLANPEIHGSPMSRARALLEGDV